MSARTRFVSKLSLITLVALFATGCVGQPEWRRRAALLSDAFPRPPMPGPRCLSDEILAQGLRAAVSSVAFAEVFDYGPLYGVGCPSGGDGSLACVASTGRVGVQRFPQIDLSVVAFNPAECANKVAKATVVFDRAHPQGFVGTHDPETLQLKNIRLRKWDETRFNGARYLPLDDERARGRDEPTPDRGSELAFDAPYSDDTLLNASTAGAGFTPDSIDFMSPWPASSFKVMVGTRIMKLLDVGHTADGQPVDLQTPIMLPTEDLVGACAKQARTLTLQQTLETMLQWSGNCATAGLVRFLHQHHEIVQSPIVSPQGYPLEGPHLNMLNGMLRDLGLSSLQMNRTVELSGRWGNPNDNYDRRTSSVGNNHMPSWDAARLMWLYVDDADLLPEQRPNWRVVSTGKPVDRDFVSAKTKALFRDILRDSYSGSLLVNNRTCVPSSASNKQEFGVVPEPGINALLSEKWLDGKKLRHPYGNHPYVDVVDDVGPGGEDSSKSGDLSPCQRRAEVEYLNKPGMTNVAGSSVGIVRGLERGFWRGNYRRRYIVSFFSSLGARYSDEARAKAAGPGREAHGITQTIPKLGATLDAWLALWLEKE